MLIAALAAKHKPKPRKAPLGPSPTHTQALSATVACLPAAYVTGRKALCFAIEPRVNDLCKLSFYGTVGEDVSHPI